MVIGIARKLIAAALVLTGLYLLAFGNTWGPQLSAALEVTELGTWIGLVIPFLPMVFIGFGAGAAELKTLVEVYQVTAQGLRPLDSAEVSAAGGKMPGMLVPVAGGAAAGHAAKSVVISGGISAAKEFGPESIQGTAKRTADEISELLEKDFDKRNWLASS